MAARNGSGFRVVPIALGGCGLLVVLVVVGICAGCILMTGGHEGRARLANNMERYALDYLEKHQILQPEESVVAYYDATLTLDGSEAAVLTNRRIIYHKDGRNTSIRLEDIESVNHSTQPLIGDIIDVTGRDGTMMRIEIAPLNDGRLFLDALRNQWRLKGGK